MTVTGLLTMIVIGTVVGWAGRLVVPGRHSIPIWATLVVGVVAAFVGTFLASAFGVAQTSGIDWLEVLFQVLSAAAGVAVVAIPYRRRAAGGRTSGHAVAEFPPPPRGETRSPMQTPVRREPTPTPSHIFVSYRRADSRYAARVIAEHLRDQFGRSEVFMDVDSLEAGVDFVDGVLDAIRASAVVLVLMGEQWLGAEDRSGRRRLDDPTDNVRTEIEHALRWKKHVLPVLLDGADMPHQADLPATVAPLTRLNAIRLDHVSWDVDIVKLIEAVMRYRP
jgi:uncharacterized membrane protein YeaQ/YmgE (transglycosylase-associated protein family)